MLTEDLIEVVEDLTCSVNRVAGAITPTDAAPGKDATGGSVASLTEAVMGISAGLIRVADAIQSLAEAVEANG